MAEVVVTAALGVAQLALPTLHLIHSHKIVPKIKNMASWRTFMKAYMEDMNCKHQGGRMLEDQKNKVRDIAYDIEDVLQEYVRHTTSSHKHKITRKVHNKAHQIRHGFPLRESSSSSGSELHTVSSPLLLDDEMVGYERPKTEFMGQLVDGETRLLTLAEDGSTTSQKLRRYLAGKRYIVALDDVWKKEEHWDYIKNALPDANRGSRIIVTTSSSNLASTCASSTHHLYNLEILEWLEGWTLFCRKAFPEINGECPADLKDSSVKIVKRCEGLPLAIVTIGAALAHKPRRPNEWERFQDNHGDEFRSGCNLSIITNCLLPSYMDLSINLKCCFVYFSIFPEDYSVKRARLIRLWVAEGFAMETDYKTAEEVAEEHLSELIQMNLVHVSDWDFDGRPRNIRVLNFFLEFIIQKCKDENFASIFPRETTSQNKKIRRLSVHNDYTHLPGDSGFCGVRSMFLMSRLPPGFEKDLCKCKFLRVLDVQGPVLKEFPKDIDRLTLLKYLSFRDTKIKMIPSSIKNLSSLETLDLIQTDVTELPKEISYLHKLCHLFVYKIDSVQGDDKFNSVQGAKVCEGIKGIDKLTNLQDLTLIKLGQNGGILKDMKIFTLLRKLGLVGHKREHGKDLCTAVQLMINLTTLDLSAATKEEFLEVGEKTNPPQTLQCLYLKWRLKEIPSWISSLNNLLRIGLMWSKLEASPLQALERLPHLMDLQLVDCCIEAELTFNVSGFIKLKSLEIEGHTRLHTIVIREGAMPQLKQISISRCPQASTDDVSTGHAVSHQP